MQDEIDAEARLATQVDVANVASNEFMLSKRATPGKRALSLTNVRQMAATQIIQADYILAKSEQVFDQVRSDESCSTCYQPSVSVLRKPMPHSSNRCHQSTFTNATLARRALLTPLHLRFPWRRSRPHSSGAS